MEQQINWNKLALIRKFVLDSGTSEVYHETIYRVIQTHINLKNWQEAEKLITNFEI